MTMNRNISFLDDMKSLVDQNKFPTDGISVRGAREHSLKNINVFIPYGKITVITGVSGSGKSSLAFDTLFAEGQRRYLDSFSLYARQFLDKKKRPEVDAIIGLPPTIAIDQKSVVHSSRSNVGTITEISDFLRLYFSKGATPHCPLHDIPLKQKTITEIIDEIFNSEHYKTGQYFYLLSPIVERKKGEFNRIFQKWIRDGFFKAKIDGNFLDLHESLKLKKTQFHDIDLVVDQLTIKASLKTRLIQSLQKAQKLGEGRIIIETLDGKRKLFSLIASCSRCAYSIGSIDSRHLNPNHPLGACKTCEGLGFLSREELKEEKDDEEDVEQKFCSNCHGTGLNAQALSIKIKGKNISYYLSSPVEELIEKIDANQKEFGHKAELIKKITTEIKRRVTFLEKVGLGYLSIDRPVKTLSGGEAQRVRLAAQMGCGLVGVLYVLDEPSIGLHPADHHRLLSILKDLQRAGNTILLVEHDEETMRSADLIIDMGPEAGERGGQILWTGSLKDLKQKPETLTQAYLLGERSCQVNSPVDFKTPSESKIEIYGAKIHNLKSLNVTFPTDRFTVVTGVSGSGKSSLVMDILYKNLNSGLKKNNTSENVDNFVNKSGLNKVIHITQKPIGRTPRSIPATYVGITPLIRELFSQLPESQARGFGPGRFSFNVKGGRCDHCEGTGTLKLDMQFMADVYVPCDLCNGLRFSPETLKVRYKKASIADVLEMSVDHAFDFFKNHTLIARKLKTLQNVGLGYIRLGQSSTTLSGGEAQRVKLAKYLSKKTHGKQLFILDEPTTGLHFHDVYKLLTSLRALIKQGHGIIVIEHHLDVIKSADWIIDLGPGGGSKGGKLVYEGPLAGLKKIKNSATAHYL